MIRECENKTAFHTKRRRLTGRPRKRWYRAGRGNSSVVKNRGHRREGTSEVDRHAEQKASKEPEDRKAAV
jgi:hypothetical protein